MSKESLFWIIESKMEDPRNKGDLFFEGYELFLFVLRDWLHQHQLRKCGHAESFVVMHEQNIAIPAETIEVLMAVIRNWFLEQGYCIRNIRIFNESSVTSTSAAKMWRFWCRFHHKGKDLSEQMRDEFLLYLVKNVEMQNAQIGGHCDDFCLENEKPTLLSLETAIRVKESMIQWAVDHDCEILQLGFWNPEL